MNVFFGLDGSEHSFAAVSRAGHLLQPGRDRVALYHSCDGIQVSNVDDAFHDRACRAVSIVIFDEGRNRLPEPLRTSVETIVGQERASHELVEAAEKWGADLIVVGARGLGPVEGLLLGSVSSTVVRAAKSPVLVVRHLPKDKNDWANGVRVLMAFDQANALRHAEVVNQLVWPAGSAGQVVAVIESLLPSHLPAWIQKRARDADTEAMSQVWVREHEQEREKALGELTAYQQQLPAAFRSTPPIVAEGNPAEQLLIVMHKQKSELVIVGKTSRTLFDRLILGSTSEKILSQGPASVLVVPSKAG
jgi:nucleotide-binding universal stress UspA family protein